MINRALVRLRRYRLEINIACDIYLGNIFLEKLTQIKVHFNLYLVFGKREYII